MDLIVMGVPSACSSSSSDSTPAGSGNGAMTVHLVDGPLASADQSDFITLRAALTSPTAGSHTFIVATGMAAVGALTETFAFGSVPAGTYSFQGQRTTANADGTFTTGLSAVVPGIAVTAAGTAAVTVAF